MSSIINNNNNNHHHLIIHFLYIILIKINNYKVFYKGQAESNKRNRKRNKGQYKIPNTHVHIQCHIHTIQYIYTLTEIHTTSHTFKSTSLPD